MVKSERLETEMESLTAWQYEKLQYLGSEPEDERRFLFIPLEQFLLLSSKQGRRMRKLVQLGLIEKTEETEINGKMHAILFFTETGRIAFGQSFDEFGNRKPEYIN